MIADEFQALCMQCVEIIKDNAPKRTGNLAYNSIRYEYVSEDECKIYVDIVQAPYMPYTNEPWVSPRWNGKKNPNEKWWERARDKIIENIKNLGD